MCILHNIMDKIHTTTKDKILTLLIFHRTEELSIREIAKRVKIDYKTVYLIIKKLAEDEIINIRRISQTSLCSINQKSFNPDIFKAETIRRNKILKNKDFLVLYKQIKEEVKSPFFTLLLFGSHASGKAKKQSDIDLMLITNEHSIKDKIKNIISLLPLKIHLLDFTTKEFTSMIKTTEFNVGKEAKENNIVLFGTENYYELINHA